MDAEKIRKLIKFRYPIVTKYPKTMRLVLWLIGIALFQYGLKLYSEDFYVFAGNVKGKESEPISFFIHTAFRYCGLGSLAVFYAIIGGKTYQ